MERFRLTDDFLAKYKEVKPPFGFNGLGELAYLRTYSRIKEDGSNEVWWETCRRVVEGTYNMQKAWIEMNGLGWNPQKAQFSAQEMYDRMFHMKWLPPGRGLWAMGSPITEERGCYAALNNCFAHETEIITREGIKRIGDCVGTIQTLLSRNGKWIKSPIQIFGIRPLRKITFRRQGRDMIVYATPDHRWFAKSPSDVSHNKGFKEYVTDELKPGYRMQYMFGQGIKDLEPNPFGIAHGIAFGDGTKSSNAHLYLCGEKADLAKWFPLNHATPALDKNATRISNIPLGFKRLPDLSEHRTYLLGWLMGYFAADGCLTEAGQAIIYSYTRENLEFVRSVCAILGIGTFDIREERVTSNLDGEDYISYKIQLMLQFLTEDFFLLSKHKERFKQLEVESRHFCNWNVVSVEETDRVEEVFCATVPDEGAFTLAGNILTGNCGFVSTKDIATTGSDPFCFLMDASMLGVGVGFDTRGAGTITIRKPRPVVETMVIPDSREGWVESVRRLLDSYFKGGPTMEFDYSEIRPAGVPIKGFGGVASGPEPLKRLHEDLRKLLDAHDCKEISKRLIVDIMNLIGKCVVAGNVRRTAEIAIDFDWDDMDYLTLKHYETNPDRAEYGWASNNSVAAPLGADYSQSAKFVRYNGEPGYIWLDNIRGYSRMNNGPDFKDKRADGCNPCVEQSLESHELCCLVETFPNKHKDLADYKRTLKFAYMYAKTVTLGKTHWPETNRILLRNRRIGCSMSGIVQFIASRGLHTLKEWATAGYATLEYYDEVYSDWLCVPRSIKMTSVKPSGTVSLLAGATPGMHFPESRYYIRRMRIDNKSELIPALVEAGYKVEPCIGQEDSTVVVEIPVKIEENVRTVSEVSMWEQLALAAFLQRYWADNQVSCTVTFDPETEGAQIANALNFYQYQLKGVSFLPRSERGAFPQMPYEEISEEQYETLAANLKPLDFSKVRGERADVERFCDGDKCMIGAH